MEFEILTASYKDSTLRYITPDNDLLFNSNDIAMILGIDANARTRAPLLSQPCIDLADAVWLAENKDHDFGEWLVSTFRNYRITAAVHPGCDDDWTTFE